MFELFFTSPERLIALMLRGAEFSSRAASVVVARATAEPAAAAAAAAAVSASMRCCSCSCFCACHCCSGLSTAG